jgi:transglutaminase-like putative cysteine protease
MLIHVRHTTTYHYESPASYAIETLRLTPPSFAGQTVNSWSIVAPGIETALRFTDGFGNQATLVTSDQVHTEIVIVAQGSVQTRDCAGIVNGLADPAPARVFLRETPATRPDEAIRALAAGADGETELARLHDLMNTIRDRIDYRTGTSTPSTTAAAALDQEAGVCQDHAHVFIAAARCLGIPARYVNGYFVTGATQPDAAHHAWAEAKVENLGWVGFDVANRVCPDDRFVRLACGLDAVSASPIRGRRPLPLGAQSQKERLDVVVEVHQQQQQSQQQQQT